MSAPENSQKRLLWFMFICGTFLYFFANIQRVAIPGTVFDVLQSNLHVSAPWITGLGAAFMYVYAVNQLFTGLLIERYGGIRIIACGVIFFCIGSLLFPLTDSLPVLYLSRILTGFGASVIYLSMIPLIVRLGGGSYGILLSIFIMIGFTGGITANAPFTICVEKFGLAPVLLSVGFAALAVYLLYVLAASRLALEPVKNESKISLSVFGNVLKNRHNCALYVFAGINFGLYYVLQTVIGKKFLEDYCGMASDSAAWILSVMGAISALGGFALAVLSRLSGNKRRIFCLVAGSICLSTFTLLTLLLMLDCRSPWIGAVFCFFSATASMSTITIPLLRETNTESLAGPSVAFMNFSFYMAVAFFGNLAGWLMNAFPPEFRSGVYIYSRSSYLLVFSVLLCFAVLSFTCSTRMREPARG